jgi:hypothetical protein
MQAQALPLSHALSRNIRFDQPHALAWRVGILEGARVCTYLWSEESLRHQWHVEMNKFQVPNLLQ